jgi:uncharacterized ParB-like nuclease family protein
MSDNEKRNPPAGLDLSSLQNMDFSSMMNNLMKNVDMNKFQSMLSSLNLNGDSLNKFMETMSSAPADGKGSLDMNQLNSMASNILKNMDTNKFQSVVSNMTGNNSNDNNGLSDMLGSIMSAMQNPVQNQPAQTPQAASAGEQKADFQGSEAKQKNMMESILSTFKMPEGIMNTSAIGALNIGGGQGDLKNQFEAVLSSMKMDDAAKDKMRATMIL